MKIIEFLESTIDGKLSLDAQKKYLVASPFPDASEIAQAVKYLRGQMPEVPKLPDAIDICGTGGSGLKRINTSTISAFVVAAAGVPIAKHGNNSASGHFGSFDLLAAMDVPIKLSNTELQARFHEFGLAFLYAKSFHPAMRHFAAVRAQLDKPTFFNILGPLLSPVDAQKQIIGTSTVANARLIAEVAKKLGKHRVIVVSGSDGLDEVTLNGQTHVIELYKDNLKEYNLSPSDFGTKPIKNFAEISSSSAEDNIKFAENILQGRNKTRRSDLVLVNSALALYLAGKAKDLKSAFRQSKQILSSGKADQLLENYRRPSVLSRIAANDISRNFNQDKAYPIEINHKPVLYKGGLIAEIKQRSPSQGILRKNANYLDMAKIYTRSGASAISVLTEPKNFGGDFYKFSRARAGTHLPLLCKDFILRKAHIDKAKAIGADMILLIVAMLDDKKLGELYNHATSQNLQVLVEVHSQDELSRSLKLNPKIIGVNSRNLHDFSIDKNLFSQLFGQIPKGIIRVAESGIKTFQDIPSGYDGILVGSEIMKYPFPKIKIKELAGKPILKLCGIRTSDQAELCESLGIDLIGVNFVPRSHRKVTVDTAREITGGCKNTIAVGIFENQDPAEVNEIAANSGVKAIQLSGQEQDLEKYNLPVIKTVKVGQTKPEPAFLAIVDADKPGAGKTFDHNEIIQHEPSLIAGGINLENAKSLQAAKQPLGFDVASGIETDGEIDTKKIESFAKLFA